MIAVAQKKKPSKQPPRRRRKAPVEAKPRWIWPSQEKETDEKAVPERGESAVQHGGLARGRRSKLFPDLNISATAEKLGITKSHLAKVLAGKNKPSLDLAVKLADALGKDLLFVAALGHNTNVDTTPTRKSQPSKRKKKTTNGKSNRGTDR